MRKLLLSVSALATMAVCLTACSGTDPAVSGVSSPSAVESPAAATETAAASSVTSLPVQTTYDGKVIAMEPENDNLRMLASAQEYVQAMTSSRYVLSGEWVTDGFKSSDLAVLYKNLITPALADKLMAATSIEDITPMPQLMVLGLGTTTEAGGVKASTACKEITRESCTVLVEQEHGGQKIFLPGGTGIDMTTVEYLPEGQLKFTANHFLPVATFDDVESYMDTNIAVDVTMVANPNAGKPGQLPYLVDHVNNKQTNAGIHPISDTVQIN